MGALHKVTNHRAGADDFSCLRQWRGEATGARVGHESMRLWSEAVVTRHSEGDGAGWWLTSYGHLHHLWRGHARCCYVCLEIGLEGRVDEGLEERLRKPALVEFGGH